MTNPVTPIYGLPYQDADSQPESSLSGGSSGTELILAEEVETELARIDGDIADLQADIGKGWVPIDSGSFSGSPPFTIDATAGGAYPAGTFHAMRLRGYGSLTGSAGHVTVRINNDTTTDLHQTARIRDLASDGSTTDSGLSTGTVYRVARWGTLAEASTFECLLLGTAVQSQVPFQSEGAALGSTAAVSSWFRFWGQLDDAIASLLVSSLRISTFDAASDFTAIHWTLEGYKP